MKPSLILSVALVGALFALGGCTARGSGEPLGRATTRDDKSTDEGSVEPPPSGLGATLSPRQLRRLSAREYNNVIRDLLGDDSRPADRFIPDAYQNGYDNGSVGLVIQSDQVFAYQRAAEVVAAHAVANAMDRLVGGCNSAERGVEECESAFLHTFAPRAFRRPLSASETERVDDVFRAGAAAGGFSMGLQTALELILQSPQFLYREELGPIEALAGSGREIHLTDYEVASELSFLLTGSLPDDEVWTAVQQGRFATPEDRRREAMRLLASGAANETLRSFLHQWFGTTRLADLRKDRRFYPTFDSILATSMTTELDRFYDANLFSGDGSRRRIERGELPRPLRAAARQPFGRLRGGAERRSRRRHRHRRAGRSRPRALRGPTSSRSRFSRASQDGYREGALLEFTIGRWSPVGGRGRRPRRRGVRVKRSNQQPAGRRWGAWS